MTSSNLKAAIEADTEYTSQEFTFIFNRIEVSVIVASVITCKEQLNAPYDRALCEAVLARIQANEAYQQSKRLRQGLLS